MLPSTYAFQVVDDKADGHFLFEPQKLHQLVGNPAFDDVHIYLA
jgi:hypothetical protein